MSRLSSQRPGGQDPTSLDRCQCNTTHHTVRHIFPGMPQLDHTTHIWEISRRPEWSSKQHEVGSTPRYVEQRQGYNNCRSLVSGLAHVVISTLAGYIVGFDTTLGRVVSFAGGLGSCIGDRWNDDSSIREDPIPSHWSPNYHVHVCHVIVMFMFYRLPG